MPSFEDGELKLFESGAIVLHIAEKSDALMPADEEGRSRARTWVFAALNTVEPHIQELAGIDLFWPGQAWTKERRPMVEKMVRLRLERTRRRRWMDATTWRIVSPPAT